MAMLTIVGIGSQLQRGLFVEASERGTSFSCSGSASSLFIGVALLSSRLVKPLATVVGWPAGHLAGSAGRLARENAVRNPSRTAATAAALMIGLALVSVVAVLGASLRDSANSAVEKQIDTDYALTHDNGFDPVPADAGEALAAAPGVELASSVRSTRPSLQARRSTSGRGAHDDLPVLRLRVVARLGGHLTGSAATARS